MRWPDVWLCPTRPFDGGWMLPLRRTLSWRPNALTSMWLDAFELGSDTCE